MEIFATTRSWGVLGRVVTNRCAEKHAYHASFLSVGRGRFAISLNLSRPNRYEHSWRNRSRTPGALVCQRRLASAGAVRFRAQVSWRAGFNAQGKWMCEIACVFLETCCLQGLDSGAITAGAMHAFIRSVGCPVEFLSGKRRWKSGHVEMISDCSSEFRQSRGVADFPAEQD